MRYCKAWSIFAVIFGIVSYSDDVLASAPHLPAQRGIEAPAGFSSACRKYAFLCGPRTGARMTDADLLALADRVNRAVNAEIRPLDDAANYGRAEYWTLPEAGAGDCEDYALLKKKRLVEAGVDSRALTMAVVLDRAAAPHTVLMLRLESGDVVLDNLVDAIMPWAETGLTFVARQQARDKRAWRVTLAGPYASRFADRAIAATASGGAGR